MNITEWTEYERNRQEVISFNRSRRMRKQPLLEQPPKIDAPKRVMLLHSGNGDYIGTWNHDDSRRAIADAIESGEITSERGAKIVFV